MISAQDINIFQALLQLRDNFYGPSHGVAALKQKSPPRFLGAGRCKSVTYFTLRLPLLLPPVLQPAPRA